MKKLNENIHDFFDWIRKTNNDFGINQSKPTPTATSTPPAAKTPAPAPAPAPAPIKDFSYYKDKIDNGFRVNPAWENLSIGNVRSFVEKLLERPLSKKTLDEIAKSGADFHGSTKKYSELKRGLRDKAISLAKSIKTPEDLELALVYYTFMNVINSKHEKIVAGKDSHAAAIETKTAEILASWAEGLKKVKIDKIIKNPKLEPDQKTEQVVNYITEYLAAKHKEFQKKIHSLIELYEKNRQIGKLHISPEDLSNLREANYQKYLAGVTNSLIVNND